MEVRTFFSALKTEDIWITSKTSPGKAATISVQSIAQGTNSYCESQQRDKRKKKKRFARRKEENNFKETYDKKIKQYYRSAKGKKKKHVDKDEERKHDALK